MFGFLLGEKKYCDLFLKVGQRTIPLIHMLDLNLPVIFNL